MKPSPFIDYYQLEHDVLLPPVTIGKRIVIVGQSAEGEYYSPIRVTNSKVARSVFREGGVVDRYEELTRHFPLDAYLMRVPEKGFGEALKALHYLPFDFVYFDDIYFNQHHDEVQNFIAFAEEKESLGNLVHGIFEVKDCIVYEDFLSVIEDVKQLSKPVSDGIKETGKYLSIVADQFIGQKSGIVYMGLINALEPEVSPINKTINLELKHEFSRNEIHELRDSGIVCFRESVKNGVVCASSSCAVATEGSVHKNICNFRIAQTLINELTYEQESLIGETYAGEHIEKLKELTRSVLDEQISQNRIRSYSYTIVLDDANKVHTHIEFVPIFSVYEMSASAQVRMSA